MVSNGFAIFMHRRYLNKFKEKGNKKKDTKFNFKESLVVFFFGQLISQD